MIKSATAWRRLLGILEGPVDLLVKEFNDF